MRTHKFEKYWGVYHCKKCGNRIVGILYFIGNDDTYCHNCFPQMERKFKLKNLESLK